MNIVLNGEDRQVCSSDLAALLAECSYDDQIVATAVNGEFVPIDFRKKQQLKDGDRVEILAPMQGG